MVEVVFAVVGNVKIRPTVIIVIADCAAVAPAVVGYASRSRHVSEGTVVIVVKEGRVRRRGFAVESVIGRAVHEINVEPTVVVVVKQAHARPLDLENQALCGRACLVMPGGKPGSRSNIVKHDGACLDETAGSDWPVLAVEFGCFRAGIRHPT